MVRNIVDRAHQEDYANLIDELAKHTTNILLAGLPPFEISANWPALIRPDLR